MPTRNLEWGRNPATGKLQWDFDINDYATIAGSWFGTKTESVYYDDFESRSVGAVSGSVGSLNWSLSTGSSISTSNPHSGTKSVVHNYSSNDFPKAYKTLSGVNRNVYMSCWFFFSGTVAAGTVWKLGRVGYGTIYTGIARAGASYTSSGTTDHPQSFGGEIRTDPSGTGITSSSSHMTGTNTTPTAAFINGQWHFYEIEFYAGTLNGNDCYFEERVNGKITARWVNRLFLTDAYPNLPNWILTPINGMDNSPSITYSVDEVYISESRSRVVMTDSATYSASTKWCAQEDLVNGWSDTLIYYKPKRGSFTQGATAYLHVFNNGVLVDTKPVVVP